MSYLLDTDICIYWLNGRPSLKDKLLAVGRDQVAISVITQAELYYGAYNSSRVQENLKRVEDFLSQIPVISLHKVTLKRFWRIEVSTSPNRPTLAGL